MDTLRQLVSVGFVLALAAALAWRIRGRAGRRGRGERRLAVLERAALTPHHSLHLVRLGDREAVVATHASGATLLAGWGPGPEQAAGR